MQPPMAQPQQWLLLGDPIILESYEADAVNRQKPKAQVFSQLESGKGDTGHAAASWYSPTPYAQAPEESWGGLYFLPRGEGNRCEPWLRAVRHIHIKHGLQHVFYLEV